MTTSHWLKDRWSEVKGLLLCDRFSAKEGQHQDRRLTRATDGNNPFPTNRFRRYTLSQAKRMQLGIPPASPRCTLSSLPSEVRVMIWDYTFGGNLIVLYRGRRHLTHTLLGENNS